MRQGRYCFCCTVYSPCFFFYNFFAGVYFYFIYIGVLPASISDSLEQELEKVASTLWMLGIEPRCYGRVLLPIESSLHPYPASFYVVFYVPSRDKLALPSEPSPATHTDLEHIATGSALSLWVIPQVESKWWPLKDQRKLGVGGR